jgi:hypothetical protein
MSEDRTNRQATMQPPIWSESDPILTWVVRCDGLPEVVISDGTASGWAFGGPSHRLFDSHLSARNQRSPSPT